MTDSKKIVAWVALLILCIYTGFWVGNVHMNDWWSVPTIVICILGGLISVNEAIELTES